MYFLKGKGKQMISYLIILGFVIVLAIAINTVNNNVKQQSEKISNTITASAKENSTKKEKKEKTIPIKKEIKKPKKKKKKSIHKYYYIKESGSCEAHLEKELQDYIYKKCEETKLTKAYPLIIAQAYIESGFKKNLISKTNDYGLMQINKCNHKWIAKITGNNDFLDPYNSIDAAFEMYKIHYKKYKSIKKMFIAYNNAKRVKYGDSLYARKIYNTRKNKLKELKEG